ncbi:ATP-binding protein [candidate division KSB1 bacterium]|nr:ATP-binding protein [candidate division KSB1 bacterium]
MTKKTLEYSVKLPSHTDNLELIRTFVAGVAKKVGFQSEDINKIELAVDEACTNVVEHAYKEKENENIDVAIQIDYQKFTVVVTDKGKRFSPADIDIPDMDQYLAELRVGGLGIYLMKTLMDEVQYHTGPDGKNRVKMVKHFLKR